MYTKVDVNSMREKLIAECDKSKGRKDGAINCNICKIANVCRSVSGHPPKYMTAEKIVKLWELSNFSKKTTVQSPVSANYVRRSSPMVESCGL